MISNASLIEMMVDWVCQKFMHFMDTKYREITSEGHSVLHVNISMGSGGVPLLMPLSRAASTYRASALYQILRVWT